MAELHLPLLTPNLSPFWHHNLKWTLDPGKTESRELGRCLVGVWLQCHTRGNGLLPPHGVTVALAAFLVKFLKRETHALASDTGCEPQLATPPPPPLAVT